MALELLCALNGTKTKLQYGFATLVTRIIQRKFLRENK